MTKLSAQLEIAFHAGSSSSSTIGPSAACLRLLRWGWR